MQLNLKLKSTTEPESSPKLDLTLNGDECPVESSSPQLDLTFKEVNCEAGIGSSLLATGKGCDCKADVLSIINSNTFIANLFNNPTFITDIKNVIGDTFVDSPTVDFTYDLGTSTETADVIINSEDNTIEDLVAWNGTTFHTRTVTSISEEIINNLFVINNFYTTSTDCIDIPTIHPTNITLIIGTGLSYSTGDNITIYANSTHYFTAVVVSYNSGTGELNVDSASNVGTGIFCNWVVNLTSLFGLSTVVTEDTSTVDLSGSGSLLDPLRADVILSGASCNAISDIDGLWSKKFDPSYIAFGAEVSWIGPGYDYEVAAGVVSVNCFNCSFDTTPVSLAAADSTYNRFDSIVVDTSCNILVLQGVPSISPQEPFVDTSLYLVLTTIFVAANTTSPVPDECIYLENTEWTTAVGGGNVGTIAPGSTSNPFAGTKDIEGTTVNDGDYVTLTSGSTVVPRSRTSLAFKIRSKGNFDGGTASSGISFQFTLSGVPIGSPVIIQNGSYTFDSIPTTVYQTISIPTQDFSIGVLDTADGLIIKGFSTGTGLTNGWYLDNICLQTAPYVSPVVPSLTYRNGINRVGNIVELGGNLLHETLIWGEYNQLKLWGQKSYNSIFDVKQFQDWGAGADIQSWGHQGSVVPSDSSYSNVVKKRVSYAGQEYGNVGLPGSFGVAGVNEGFYESINIRSEGSTGLFEDSIDSKWAAALWHTYDTEHTELLTWYGGMPNPAGRVASPGGSTHAGIYSIFSLHTDYHLQAHKYGVGTFLDNASPYILAVDASGNLTEVDPSTITTVESDPIALAKTITLTQGTGITITGTATQALSANPSWTIASSGILTASNGLTAASNNVKLGGLLVNNTTVDQSNKSISFNNSDGTYILSDPANNLWQFGNGSDFGTNIIINDGPGGGSTNNSLKVLQNGVRVLELNVLARNYVLGNQDGGGGTLLTVNDSAQTVTATNEVHLSSYGVGAYTGILTKILGVTAAGKVIETTLSGLGGITGITADNGLTANTSTNVRLGGTLLSNTTITASTFTLFVSKAVAGNALEVTNSSGNAFSATGSGVAISGTSSNLPAWLLNSDTTNGVSRDALLLSRIGFNASANTGVGILSSIVNSAGAGVNASRLKTIFTTSTSTAEIAQFELYLANAGALPRRLAVKGATGQLVLDGYGSGTITGSAAYWLAVDSSGNLIEMAAPGGGGSGEVNTASNLGTTTYGLFASKVGVDLQFKSLIAGTGITMSATSTEVTVNSSITQYTDEMAQDSLAAAFAAGTHTDLTVTYTDASNKFDFVNTSPGKRYATFTIGSSDANDTTASHYDYVCDGTADDVQINAAITALPAAGGIIRLSEGKFYISASLVAINNVRIVGAGAGTTLIWTGSAGGKIFTNTATTGVELLDFRLDGDLIAGYAVYFELIGSGEGLTAVAGLNIKNLWLTGFKQSGIELRSCRHSTIHNVKMVNAHNAAGYYFDGFVLRKKAGQAKGCLGVIVSEGHTFNCTAGVWITDSEHCKISGGYFEGDPANNLGALLVQIEASTNITINGATVRNGTDAGIYVDASCSDVTINGNEVDTMSSDGYAAIYCEGIDSVISNNIIHDVAGSAIISAGIHNVISGNKIKNAGTLANNSYAAILINANYCNATGNNIRSIVANKHQYGIRSTSIVVATSNICRNAVTTDISLTNASSEQAHNIES